MTSHVIAYLSLDLLFGMHTFNLNCFFEDFNCVFMQIRCLSRELEEYVVECSLSLLVQPCYMSRLLQRMLVNSAWSHIKPGGNVFNKKEFIQQKVGGRMSDTKKHNFMRRSFHFLYRTRDTLYQLMSVDIESP